MANLRAAELAFGFISKIMSNSFFGISDVQTINSSYFHTWYKYSLFLIFRKYRILKSV